MILKSCDFQSYWGGVLLLLRLSASDATQCISVWYGNSSNQDCKTLQRVVWLAERISRSALPSLQDIYLKRCKSRAAKIIKDSNHPGNRLFILLPSGKRFRSIWDPGSSVRMPQNALPSVPSTPTPYRCTTTGMSILPLEPLAQRLEAWLTLPSLSCWLTHTIQLGYVIQFARRPPKFNGVLETSVAVRNAPVLHEEIAVLLAKDAIEPVPPAEVRQGFYSPYFIVPKKGGGLRPILDLQVPFKMLTHRRMIKCIQPQDFFAAIDLKDAYFHFSILPRHRPFLRFAFEGRAWQYRVLPFGLFLSTCVFMEVVESALTPLREVGVRILNYLDDWLILAQSKEQLGDHRDLVLRHLSQLGLRVNWEKSKLSPVQRILFSVWS